MITDGIHASLVVKVNRVLAAMLALGYPMRICQGVRTVAQQQELYAQGRTAPGLIVTNCDGILKKSRHQLASDGFGHAVDCCFVAKDPWVGPWKVYGEAGKALGLTWGGDFKSPVDRPHLELSV